MINWLEKRPITSICIIVAVMLLPNLDSLQVSIMEARNFITAREMVTDGNWLLTTMNGEARYEKPPLPTWLTAISAIIFGLKSVFGLRLPAVLMIMVIGIFIFKLSHIILKNIPHSFINALVVITSFYLIGIIMEAPWDIYTHGFMLIAIYHLFLLFKKENNYWKHTLLAGLFIGFSFLSKGPVSMYVLLLSFLLAYGLSYKYKNFKPKAFSVFSVLIIALVIGFWWYLYVRFEDPETITAIAKREATNWSSYNVRPFYYYWSFFTQSGLWTIPAFISLLYPYLKTRVTNLKAYRLSFLWTIFAVILLSVIPEKKSRYLMPVLIPMAINIGFYIEYLIRTFKTLKDKRETIPVYFNFGLIAFIGIIFPIAGYVVLKDYLSGYWLNFIIASVVLSAIGLLIVWQLKKKHIKQVVLLTILFFVSLLITVVPLFKTMIGSNYNAISELNANASEENLTVFSLNGVSPEVIWQFGDKISRIHQVNSSFNFPKENQFGMLANGMSPEEETLLKDQYNIKYVTTFDLNLVPRKSKKHKSRLLNHYYILTKK